MHSSSNERTVFKFLIGLSVFTVVGFFNNCGGDFTRPMSQKNHVEMSSSSGSSYVTEEANDELKDVTRYSQPE